MRVPAALADGWHDALRTTTADHLCPSDRETRVFYFIAGLPDVRRSKLSWPWAYPCATYSLGRRRHQPRGRNWYYAGQSRRLTYPDNAGGALP